MWSVPPRSCPPRCATINGLGALFRFRKTCFFWPAARTSFWGSGAMCSSGLCASVYMSKYVVSGGGGLSRKNLAFSRSGVSPSSSRWRSVSCDSIALKMPAADAPASVPTPATLEDEMSPTASGVAAPASFGRKKTGPSWGSCSPATLTQPPPPPPARLLTQGIFGFGGDSSSPSAAAAPPFCWRNPSSRGKPGPG